MTITRTIKKCFRMLLVVLISSFPVTCHAQAYEPLYEALPPVYNSGKAPPTPVSHPPYIPTHAPAPPTPTPQPVTFESTTEATTTFIPITTTTTGASTTKASAAPSASEIYTEDPKSEKPIRKPIHKPNRVPTSAPKSKPKAPESNPRYNPKFVPKKIKSRPAKGPVSRPKYVRPKSKSTTSTSAPTNLQTTKSRPVYKNPAQQKPEVGPQYPPHRLGYPQPPQYPAIPSYQPIGPHYSEGSRPLKPYSFKYEVKVGNTGPDFGHEEASDGKSVAGSYKVRLPDGRLQTVTYNVENDSGFLAEVQLAGKVIKQ